MGINKQIILGECVKAEYGGVIEELSQLAEHEIENSDFRK